jgi:hypothetical protein
MKRLCYIRASRTYDRLAELKVNVSMSVNGHGCLAWSFFGDSVDIGGNKSYDRPASPEICQKDFYLVGAD